jgi:hypothetical protein
LVAIYEKSCSREQNEKHVPRFLFSRETLERPLLVFLFL